MTIRGTLVAVAMITSTFVGAATAQDVGETAGLIYARDWFGWIGEEPRLESFEGRAALLH